LFGFYLIVECAPDWRNRSRPLQDIAQSLLVALLPESVFDRPREVLEQHEIKAPPITDRTSESSLIFRKAGIVVGILSTPPIGDYQFVNDPSGRWLRNIPARYVLYSPIFVSLLTST